MKQLTLHAVCLAGVLSFVSGVNAQSGDESGYNPPVQDVNEFLSAVELSQYTNANIDLFDVGQEGQTNLNGAVEQLPVEPGAAAEPESFVREGTIAPRYVPPMDASQATNAGSAFDLNRLSTNATPADRVVQEGEPGLRLNFRGAPLDMVLNYLSDAAGFIIIPETDVRGKVDLWSNQPVTKQEAVDLLNKVLAKEGYAVLRDGRTLTIVTQSEAKKRDIPVKTGYEPANIPKDQQIVTQIIPVRFINAVQLAKDLQPLMPAQTTMTANEGGNALVITDTQENIHRMAEIIKALDTTVSSLSSVRVFALRYADAKTVADMVEQVFASSDTSTSSNGRRGRGSFRFGGGPQVDTSNSDSRGRPGASKVVATADERSNSLVVSAPEDLMPTIEQMVASVDTNVEDITEIRVFRLQHADPQETADLLADLFPDTSSSQNNQSGRFPGFFRGGPPGFGGNTTTTSQTARMKKQSEVIAAPDARTRSVVVTAAHDTMEQIAKMIEQLDADPARKKKVYVYEVQNTDPTTVQQTLEDLFSGRSTTSSRSTANNGEVGTQLSTRAQQQNQNNNNNTRSATGTGGLSSGNRSFGN